MNNKNSVHFKNYRNFVTRGGRVTLRLEELRDG